MVVERNLLTHSAASPYESTRDVQQVCEICLRSRYSTESRKQLRCLGGMSVLFTLGSTLKNDADHIDRKEEACRAQSELYARHSEIFQF